MAGGAKIEGLDGVLRRLKAVDDAVRKKATKKATEAGGKVAMWEAKARVRRRSGLLYKALGTKTKAYRNTGASVTLIGPRVGFKVVKLPDGQRQRVQTKFSKLIGTRNGKTVYQNPTQYAHLLEKGTKRSQAFPFLGPAFESKKGQIVQVMTNVISNAIEDAAKGGGS